MEPQNRMQLILLFTLWTASFYSEAFLLNNNQLVQIESIIEQTTTASCGGSSAASQITWQSDNYPNTSGQPIICTLHVTPPTDTCAFRIQFQDVAFSPENRALPFTCPDKEPLFQMSHSKGISQPFCNNLTNYEGIIEVDSKDSGPFVLLLQNLKDDFNFKIDITAQPCAAIKSYRSPNICGIKNQGSAEVFFDILKDIPVPDVDDFIPSIGGGLLPVIPSIDDITGIVGIDGNTDFRMVKAPTTSKKSLLKELKKHDDYYSQGLSRLIKKDKVSVSPKQLGYNGIEPSVNEFPWMVIVAKNPERLSSAEPYLGDFLFGLVNCTGVLLDEVHVMTSATCLLRSRGLEAPLTSELMVVLGEHNELTTNESFVIRSSVERVSFPLSYDPLALKNDHAILTLSQPVEFSNSIRPICLPNEYNVFNEDYGIISGWSRGEIPFLQPFDLPLAWVPAYPFSQELCQELIQNTTQMLELIKPDFDKTNLNVTDFMCLFTFSPQSTVCLNDLGIPFFQKDQTGAYYLTGMSSAINSCSLGLPDMFGRIPPNSAFLNVALA